jgi:hypothetical protein
VDAVPVSSGRGTLRSSRKRPAKLHADNGDGFPGCRWLLCRGWICHADRPAWGGVQHRLGRQRWKVERVLIGAGKLRRLCGAALAALECSQL